MMLSTIIAVIIVIVIAIIVVVIIMAAVVNTQQIKKEHWTDIHRVGPISIPWHAYRVTEERLYERSGLLKVVESEVYLYLVTDVRLEISFIQRLCGTGTVVVKTRDEEEKDFRMVGIKKPKEMKERISRLMKENRKGRSEVIMR